MKINWNVIGALIVIVLIVVLAFNATQSRSYQGNDLNFNVDGGRVIITNTTDAPVDAIIFSRRSFTLNSPHPDVGTLRSTRTGTGVRAQSYEGQLPPGNLELSVVRGSDINFELDSAGPISVSAAPQSANGTRNTYIGAALGVLVVLYFISRTTGHTWLHLLRRKPTSDVTPQMNTN